MLNRVDTPLAAMIRRRTPGHTLEAPFYTSPEVFAADIAAVFERCWIYVGVEPDVPEPGDAMTIDIDRNAILIVRDDDMKVRAFHNVCRHRGARLVDEPKTTVGNLVCRYHAWTYNMDGALIHADHMGPGFDKSCHGLKPVHIRSLEGLLFICLADEPPADFEDMAAELGPYIAPHDLANCKVAHQSDLIERGNWKLTMENNRECYHCAGNHPELIVPMFAYGFGFAPEELNDDDRAEVARYEALLTQSCSTWEADGLPSRQIERLADRITSFRTERLPLDGDGEAHTLDTKAASKKLLGAFTHARNGALSVWTQPNSWHHFMSDHIVTFSVIPLSPDRTLLRTKWLVHKDAVEGVDYDLENLTAVWEATNKQDGELVAICQAGAAATGYQPGPYSPHTEFLVEKISDWYVRRMAEHVGEPRP